MQITEASLSIDRSLSLVITWFHGFSLTANKMIGYGYEILFLDTTGIHVWGYCHSNKTVF